MTRFSGTVLALLAALGMATVVIVSPAAMAETSAEAGKRIAFDRRLGNCMACHMMGDATLPGNIGPPLVAMKARFPDRERLRQQIYDATKRNPQSMMPPFGAHGVLSDEQIEQVIDYLLTL